MLHQSTTRWAILGILAFVGITSACDCEDNTTKPPSVSGKGTLNVSISSLTEYEVNGVRYDITCDDGTQESLYVSIENREDDTVATTSVELPATTCQITATAMKSENEETPECSSKTQEVVIVANETVELNIGVECGDEQGAVDIVTVVGPPDQTIIVSGGTFTPSKFLVECEDGTFTVEVEGGDGAYTYVWEVIDGPDNANIYDTSSDNVYTFRSDTAGEFTIQVTVTDGGGLQGTFTFPIHIGTGGIIEECDETCCLLPNGEVALGSFAWCEDIQGGTPSLLDLCSEEVCCETEDGIQTVKAMQCPIAQRLDDSLCTAETICCQTQNGLQHTLTTAEECEELEPSRIVPIEECNSKVCCLDEDAQPQTVLATQCDPENRLDDAQCLPSGNVCCSIEGTPTLTTNRECDASGGSWVPMEECSREVCCLNEEGVFSPQTQEACTEPSRPTSGDLCDIVCCDPNPTDDQGPQNMTLGQCRAEARAQGHTFQVLAESFCNEPQTSIWNANATLPEDVDCADSPYLVVPSSAANQLAVYDLETLLPLDTSPFDVCGNPSRVLMDRNTDVYAACRAGGGVSSRTKDGAVRWDTTIPGCTAMRGITMTATGRLFAGCTETRTIYELDPLTGNIVLDDNGTPVEHNTGYSIYGIWATNNGIWVSHRTERRATFHSFNPDGTLSRTVDLPLANAQDAPGYSPPYGVTADPEGNGWFTLWRGNGGGFWTVRVDQSGNGQAFQLTSIPTNTTLTSNGGLQAGLDGKIYISADSWGKNIANMDESGVLILDPSTNPPTQTWVSIANGTGPYNTHGLTLDSANNTYLVDREGERLHKVEAGSNTVTEFGPRSDGTQILSLPYGYSGDMTGITTTCLSGVQDDFFADVIDTMNPNTIWESLSWDATTPNGTSVRVYYSLDGVNWTETSNGAALQLSSGSQSVAPLVGQRFYVKATLAASNSDVAVPTLNNVTVTYR